MRRVSVSAPVPLHPTERAIISSYVRFPFHLTPTFWTKIFLAAGKMGVFFFCCAFLRQETLLSCELLTGSPQNNAAVAQKGGEKKERQKKISPHPLFFRSPAFFQYQTQPVTITTSQSSDDFLIISIRVGRESKWIMMTAVIQTDCVIFRAVCLGLVRRGITSVKQLWI